MSMKINTDECTACGDCADACTSLAIKSKGAFFQIDADLCNECDGDVIQKCADVCPSACVTYL